MGHRLKKIRVDKIAILTEANPATGIPLVILKSNEDIEELLREYEDAFGEALTLQDIEKAALTKEAAKDILRLLGRYDEDIPTDISVAWKKLSRLLIKFVGYGYPKKKDEEEELEKFDKEDPWKRFPLAVPQHLIKKSEGEIEDEPLLDEPLIDDPVERRLERIEKKLDGKGSPMDAWPSLDSILPVVTSGNDGAVIKSELGPEVKLDPNKKEIPHSSQIRDDEGSIHMKKADEEDEFEWTFPLQGIDF